MSPITGNEASLICRSLVRAQAAYDGRDLLFDLDYECRERTDSAEKFPEVLADLRGRWERWDVAMLPMPDEVPGRWLIDFAAMQW